jgi:acetolactate synthase-1/2/3 large subunit
MHCQALSAHRSLAAKAKCMAFIGDGGMMMNLQELAVVKHHNLPVKMLVFENDGYSMIKGTFANVGKPRRGVDKASGLEMPDFCAVAQAFNIEADFIPHVGRLRPRDPADARASGAVSRSVHIDPEQAFMPSSSRSSRMA